VLVGYLLRGFSALNNLEACCNRFDHGEECRFYDSYPAKDTPKLASGVRGTILVAGAPLEYYKTSLIDIEDN
jgi:hypothetical protein